jgi:galactokinase
MDTSTRRGLVGSAYNERRAQCEAAAEFFGVPALRDDSSEEFKAKSNELENTVMRRARHVITENQRVLDAVAAMRAGDVRKLGILFNESHTSMRDDFEITNQALNQIVEAAKRHPACLGARMTGGGFGGCAVALVDGEQVEAFTNAVMGAYHRSSGLNAQFYACQPSQGASVTQLSIVD